MEEDYLIEEEENTYYYSQYSTREAVFRTDYYVIAKSKEEADKIIRESTDRSGVNDLANPNLYVEDGEIIDSDSGIPKNFYVCDEDDTVVISKKMLDEYECK
jgi:hypothetical protein